jgi:DNA-binding MarR family transcriptional regulator
LTEISRVYSLLHNELERIDRHELDITEVYVSDEDGQLVQIAEIYPEEASRILRAIKKSNNKTLSFISVWQNVQLSLAKELSGSAMRVLAMVVGKMKYENLAFDITQREISSFLNMSSRTVIRSVKELEKLGVIKHENKTGRRIYHVNPAYMWKGSFARLRYKLEMFKEEMDENKELWKR